MISTMSDFLSGSLLVALLWASPSLAGEHTNLKEVRRFAVESLQRSILQSVSNALTGHGKESIADPGGLVVLLADVDTEAARDLLAGLVEVDVGAATSEAVDYAVLAQGKKMRDRLEALITSPARCSVLNLSDGKVTTIPCLSKDERNRRIHRLLELIELGRRIDYVL